MVVALFSNASAFRLARASSAAFVFASADSSCADARAASAAKQSEAAANTVANRFALFIRHPLGMPKVSPPSALLQQFCGHAETTRPLGSVRVRMRPESDLSRARLSSTVRAFPTLPSKSALPTSRILKHK